jgi:hypothetical protein
LRLSPNVEMTSPMQEMAHSLTSWIEEICRIRKKFQKR